LGAGIRHDLNRLAFFDHVDESIVRRWAVQFMLQTVISLK